MSAARRAPAPTAPGGGCRGRHILAIYERLAGNKTQTAKALKIGLQTLHRKIKTYGVK